jgi:hypothetical protein
MKLDIQLSWRAACLHDGIGTDSKFVVFSADNLAAIRHNELMGKFRHLRNKIRHNIARRERHAAMTDMGLLRVKGALGGVYYE